MPRDCVAEIESAASLFVRAAQCASERSRALARGKRTLRSSHSRRVRAENESSRGICASARTETGMPGDSLGNEDSTERGLNVRSNAPLTNDTIYRSYYTMSLFGPAWAPLEAAADRNAKHREANGACRKWSRARYIPGRFRSGYKMHLLLYDARRYLRSVMEQTTTRAVYHASDVNLISGNPLEKRHVALNYTSIFYINPHEEKRLPRPSKIRITSCRSE